MLRSQSGCTQNVIGGYIGRKMIQSPQFTQDVPTGFQVTSPPVTVPPASASPAEALRSKRDAISRGQLLGITVPHLGILSRVRLRQHHTNHPGVHDTLLDRQVRHVDIGQQDPTPKDPYLIFVPAK